MRFSAVVGTRASYLDLQRGFAAKLEELEVIIAAAAERIEAERAQHEERKATLQERINDPNTPASLRRLAEEEIAQLNALTFDAMAAEREAFEAAAVEAAQMICDMTTLRARFKAELAEVQQGLDTMRSEVLGDQYAELRLRWLDSKRQVFGKLC